MLLDHRFNYPGVPSQLQSSPKVLETPGPKIVGNFGSIFVENYSRSFPENRFLQFSPIFTIPSNDINSIFVTFS